MQEAEPRAEAAEQAGAVAWPFSEEAQPMARALREALAPHYRLSLQTCA